MTGLEERLSELGRHVAFPPTPALASMVRPRLSRRPLWRRWRMIAAAVVATLALLLGVPPIRTAIAHLLGIQGVVVSPVPKLSARPARTPAASPSGLGSTLGIGSLSTLDAATESVGFTVLVPEDLGAPDAVYLRSDLGPVVTLVYAPRAGLAASGQTGVGLLVTEFRGATDPTLMQKFVGPDTTITALTVDGGAGLWLAGAPHDVAYRLPDGSTAPDSLRLAGPTLLFERGGLTLRIEGTLTQAQALAIAHSLR